MVALIITPPEFVVKIAAESRGKGMTGLSANVHTILAQFLVLEAVV